MFAFQVGETMRRYFGKILCLVSLLLLMTGCCRIYTELGGDTSPAKRPPQRFFCGTGTALMLGQYLGPPVLVVVPIELAADIVCLPLDIAIYTHYRLNPPLALLVENNQLGKLAKALEKGADPNYIDRRFGPETPLWVAFAQHNVEAYRILLDHGAQIDASPGSGMPYRDEWRDREITLLALRHGLPETRAKDPNSKRNVNEWVGGWMKAVTADPPKPEDVSQTFEVIELLLKHNFPVNNYFGRTDDDETGITALDKVLLKRELPPEEKAKMVSLLRAHGAKTYPELAKENPKLPHLNLDGIAVPPQFQPVVDLMEHSVEAAAYRVTDKHPTLEGPLLVFDYLPLKDAKAQKPYFKTIALHRRKSPTEWNQEVEKMDVPAVFRMILTDKGRKVPSQMDDSLPRLMAISEKWISLPTCEMYIAYNPLTGYRNSDLESIVGLSYPPTESIYNYRMKIEGPGGRHPGDSIFFMNGFMKKEDPMLIDESPEADDALKRLRAKTAEMQLQGEWRAIRSNNNKLTHFVFTTRRTLEELKECEYPVAPYPDELIVDASLKDYKIPEKPYEWHRLSYRNQSCNGYWNRKDCSIKHPYDAMILYGDAIPQETIKKFAPIFEQLFYHSDYKIK